MADSNNRFPHETPTKSKVRGAIEYMETQGIAHHKEYVFRYFCVGHGQGRAMISEGSLGRRHHNNPDIEKDYRGRPPLIS